MDSLEEVREEDITTIDCFFDSSIALLEQIPSLLLQDSDAALLQLELLTRDLSYLLSAGCLIIDQDTVNALYGALDEVNTIVLRKFEQDESSVFRNYVTEIPVGIRGRPRVVIPEEQIRFLKENNFKNTEIARMFLVSPRTISRRIRLYGLESLCDYSNISDDHLDTLAEDFIHNHPFSGQRSFEGFLRSHSLKIQRHRIREALYRCDPRGVQERRRRSLHRRHYSVHMPNSLWHIDTNHKLIRWNFVIFGGIDGYSRLPVFLEVHENNRSSTMLNCFLNGVGEYGLPSRVRCDKGRENVGVSECMLFVRGPGRGSCITGRSVHNQRIERFWRDLFAGCTSVYYYLFHTLEDLEVLDHTNMFDLFSLHYIFTPRICNHLKVIVACTCC